MKFDIDEFEFSQNSLNTFKSCPKKFGYKYIDKISWKNDEDEEYYESLETGRDFHLVCERYFSGIPCGNLKEKKEYKNFSKWLERIKKLIPMEKNTEYKTEYGLVTTIRGVRVKVKYDLAIIKEEDGKLKFDIWDWKTENQQIDFNKVNERMQTILYLYTAYKVLPKIYGYEIENIELRMLYYQPDFNSPPVVINYNSERFKSDEKKIEYIIEEIKKSDFSGYNIKSCKWCEFKNICGNGKSEEQKYN